MADCLSPLGETGCESPAYMDILYPVLLYVLNKTVKVKRNVPERKADGGDTDIIVRYSRFKQHFILGITLLRSRAVRLRAA